MLFLSFNKIPRRTSRCVRPRLQTLLMLTEFPLSQNHKVRQYELVFVQLDDYATLEVNLSWNQYILLWGQLKINHRIYHAVYYIQLTHKKSKWSRMKKTFIFWQLIQKWHVCAIIHLLYNYIFSIFSNICLFAFVVFLPSMDISILMTDNRGEDNGCEKPYHCALINLVLASIRFFDVNLKNKKYCNKVRCLKLFFIYVQIKFQYMFKTVDIRLN